MSNNVIDFRKWVRAVMRKFKGIAEGQFVGCDRHGAADGLVDVPYFLPDLSDDRVINGKRVGNIRAEQLEREQMRHEIKFDDPTT